MEATQIPKIRLIGNLNDAKEGKVKKAVSLQ